METRFVAGCMTGTSLDALDAALVEIRGRGLDLRATLRGQATRPLGELGERLRRFAGGAALAAKQIAELGRDFARLHVETLRELLGRKTSEAGRVDLIAVHGQTVFHAPPLSWQLLNPVPIAHALKIPVVFDLRTADLACGGQGAPITPLADYVLFRHAAETRAVVNLGGFCNFTALPRAGDERHETALRDIHGGDLCACNQLLDELARVLFGVAFDADGQRALRGQPQPAARDDLVRLLDAQAAAGRSLGTGDERLAWLERHRARCPAEDLARAACEAIAEVVICRIGNIDRLILAGGGTKNRALVGALAARSSARVSLSEEFDIPSDMREALEMAVLGALCQDRVPITLPQITKLRGPAPVAGCWVYP